MGNQARALTAALTVKRDRPAPAAVLNESSTTKNVVLGVLASLQLAGIVAFEAWVFSRRRGSAPMSGADARQPH